MTAPVDGLRLFSGTAHPALFDAICEHLHVVPGRLDVSRFGNGNIFVKLGEDVCDRQVVLVQPLAAPVNDSIMELLIMADAARRASAGRVAAVVPYYAYGRSDTRYEEGEPITARLLADLMAAAGIERVLALDLHRSGIQGYFGVLDELTSLDLFAAYYDGGPGERVVVAPHEASTRWAKGLADRLGLPLAILERTDDGRSLNVLGSVEGRPVILIENEIATGRSLATAAHRLVEHGVTHLSAAAIHPVFGPGAVELLEEAPIDELVVTDSLPVPQEVTAALRITSLSVAPLLGQAIRRLYGR